MELIVLAFSEDMMCVVQEHTVHLGSGWHQGPFMALQFLSNTVQSLHEPLHSASYQTK